MFEEDDFEIIEDDSSEDNMSSPSMNRASIPSKGNGKDAKNIQDKVDKNKSRPGNDASMDSGKVNPKENVGAQKGIDNGNQFKNAGNVANMAKGLNSNDPDEKKQALKNMGKEAIKPMVRKGVQAATGGAVGTDPVTGKIIDSAVDRVADNPNVDKIIGEVTKKIETHKRLMILKMLLPILPSVFLFLIIIIVISYLFLPVFRTSDLGDSKNRHEVKFYDELDRVADIYYKKCNMDMDTEIISASILYDQIVESYNGDIEYTDDEGNIEDMDSIMSNFNFKYKSDDILTLSKKLYPSLDFSTEEEATITSCKANYTIYKSYLTSSYMRNHYKDLTDIYDSYSEIADEILAMSGQFVIDNAYQGSYYCSGVTVLNEDGTTMGTYDLETYVAGVVEAEGYSGIVGIEALKAQAVLARTFVLYETDNCKASIESSQNKQVFREPTGNRGIEAAQATEGLILEYDSQIMSVMYDSFYTGGDYSCDANGCSVTYTKLPNYEEHTVSVSPNYTYMIAGGHGFGLSQVASYDLADQGYSYDSILYTFYSSGVEIAKMSSLLQGAIYTSSSEPPVNQDIIKERASTNTDLFYNSSKGLVSQCPWYAKSRASEIIYYSDMPEDIKDAAIRSISNTGGDGGYVVSRVDESLFAKSYDYSQPHPGSIISWSSSASDGPNCHSYGHVAIIEQVNEDGTVLVSDGWNGGGVHASNTWENIRYRLRTVSIDYLAGYTNNNGCHYTFAGYAYLLG